MAMTRRMFAQLVASALLLRHLPALAQTPLTVAVGGSPGPNITQRVVSAGAPLTCYCWLSRQKSGGFFLL